MKKILFLLLIVISVCVILTSCGGNDSVPETTKEKETTSSDKTTEAPTTELPTTELPTTELPTTEEITTKIPDPILDPIEVFDEGKPSEGDGTDWVGPY